MQRGRRTQEMLREKNRIFMLLAVIVLVFAVVLSVSGREFST